MPLVQLLAFEAYRDLVKLHQGRHVDESGICAAQQENIDLRASALAAAQVALRVSHHQAASTSVKPAGDCTAPPHETAQVSITSGDHRRTSAQWVSFLLRASENLRGDATCGGEPARCQMERNGNKTVSPPYVWAPLGIAD